MMLVIFYQIEFLGIKWVKMNNDDKARNVEHALQNLTKSNALKNLLSKNQDAVISLYCSFFK